MTDIITQKLRGSSPLDERMSNAKVKKPITPPKMPALDLDNKRAKAMTMSPMERRNCKLGRSEDIKALKLIFLCQVPMASV